MALSIVTEENKTLTAGLASEILDTSVGRNGFSLQLQAPGFVWIKLGGAPSIGDGFRISAWEIIPFSGGFPAGVGNGTDYWEGPVYALYEPAPYQDQPPRSSAPLRVIEVT